VAVKSGRRDTFSKEERSRIMRAIKGAGTKAESTFGAVLRRYHLPFRKQARELPGSPDFVCDQLRMVFFVDGDFWHGREWHERGEAPFDNREYWIAKFERNRSRDIIVERRLRRMGWAVVRIWERDLLKDLDGVYDLLCNRVHRRTNNLKFRRVVRKQEGFV
jgi:DNA mismatch endonuclease Vsr